MRPYVGFLLLFFLTACQSGPIKNWSSVFEKEPGAHPVAAASEAAEEEGDAVAVVSGPDSIEVPASEELVVFEEDEEEVCEAENSSAAVDEIPAHRVRFELPLADHPRIDYFVKNFSGPGAYDFQRRLERSGRYVPLMKKIFAEEGLPEDLVYLALIESGFIEHAYSWARAVGPWQFIEGTGRIYGLDNDWWHDERRDPVKSTRAAALHLKKLYARFGDWYLAAAAYNAGAGTIQRAIRKTGSRDFFELARRKCLRAETRNYVPKFLAALKIVREPEAYGFHNLKYLAPLEFDTVTVPTSTDLEVIARLCGTDYKKIKHLNPELKRWCTPPGKSKYNVKIPSGLGATFEKKYAGLPVNERARFKRHQIRSGDTLGGLARRYNIRVRDIKVLNSIDNPRALQIGDNLILPMQDGYNRLPLDELQDDYKRSRRKTYRVRKGDSLWTIARRFDISEKELRVWNRLGWSNTIRPGQRLVVSTKAASSRRSPAAKGRYQVEYTVAGGDTLWDIGRKFGVSTQDIRGWNKLAGSQVLHPGDKLTLHVNDLSRGRGLSPPSTSPAAADESRKEVYYQVRPGDNLWVISRKFGITTGAVQNWNGFSSGHVLRPGDRLLLKVPASLQSPLLTAAVPAKSPPSGPQPGGPLQKVVYQVRSGDTLWDIGQQFNVATRKIRHWNNLPERHVLRPGDKLTLHVAVDEKG